MNRAPRNRLIAIGQPVARTGAPAPLPGNTPQASSLHRQRHALATLGAKSFQLARFHAAQRPGSDRPPRRPGLRRCGCINRISAPAPLPRSSSRSSPRTGRPPYSFYSRYSAAGRRARPPRSPLDSLNRTDIGAGCVFTLPAQGGRRQRIAFHHPDTGRKLSRRNRRTTLVVLMGDHAGHFTGTAANTLLGIRDDKTVHPLLHWG